MASNIKGLSNMEIDVLKEIGNIGAGNAATALARMLNKRVDMEVPKVKILEINEVSDILGGAEIGVVGVLLRIGGDLSGYIMFILGIKEAHSLVNILMGKSSEDECDFSEIELSALKETGNILASSYVGALSALTNLNLKPSVPDIAIDMAGAVISVPAIEFGMVGDTVLYIETEFSDGSKKVAGEVFLVPDAKSYQALLEALGVRF